MISIKPLGSSSAGNAYLVSDGTTPLLLEAGIRYRDIQRGVEFQMSSIAACLVSHEHGDHSRSVKEVMKAGIDVYASYGTWNALGLDGHHRAHPVQSLQSFTVGTWTVLPFDVQHDVSEPMGYLLANMAGEKLVFITDSYYCRYRFSGLTHVMIETNYSSEILRENVASGRVPQVLASRLLRSHMSLETAIEFLKANDLSRVQEIFLIHLSSSNSDEAEFKRKVQQATGRQVFVAQEGRS
ncbi:MBL fold metallo-hydrolase [Alicyclobacillus ferrooxydans]|uniref:Beta-lactamase n=1 Tax=Alicyclobacillus ferrooxydans TaxID=471514 RepID=A0A0P9C9G2_9BACL|nr:MBL fold metallo-hydrolase [Alicyclobacillus ferrooxydans]KPV42000.1 beta-lactamase [Alicyclobacillus ferrooxydans]